MATIKKNGMCMFNNAADEHNGERDRREKKG